MNTQFDQLISALAREPAISLAILVGSRATDSARADSDWDIAVIFHHATDKQVQLSLDTQIRANLAHHLGTTSDKIDLIDLSRANLAMRANAAEDGKVLKGEDSLTWGHFLKRTWRELEDFYWDNAHAA